jgi:hypothetical protein
MANKSYFIKVILPVLSGIMAAGFAFTPAALAAEKGRAIRKITPVGETMNYSRQANIRAEDNFDVIGILNLKESRRVIIGDRELPLAPGARTYRVQKYNLVGARLNKAGEAVVVDLISDEPN